MVSPEAKSLILELTKTDPRRRLACGDALAHPWLNDGTNNIGSSAELPLTTQHSRRASALRRGSVTALDPSNTEPQKG